MRRLWARLLLLASLLAAASCSHSSPLPPTPTAPTTTGATAPAAAFTLVVDSRGSQEALIGLSEVTVDATASTGSALRYLVDFGDGSTVNEAVGHHVYNTAGTYRVTVTLTDVKGQTATSVRELVVASPLGAWLYSGYLSRTHAVEVRTLRLTDQQGATVRGTLSRARERDVIVTGTLTPDRQIRLVVDGLSETLEGTVPSVLTGGDAIWALTARGGFADGETFTFRAGVGEASSPPPDAVLKMRFFSFGAPFAVKGFSPVLFDGSTSRGDGLTYFIEFGDGETSIASNAVHPIANEGTYTARLTVVDRFGRSDFETAPFQVVSLITKGYYVEWDGQVVGDFGSGSVLLVDSQSGQNIAGRLYSQGVFGDTSCCFGHLFTGTLSGERDIKLVFADSSIVLAGTLYLGSPHRTLTFTIAGGPKSGRTLGFYYRDGY
ncbi:MAG: PKD domain-containing protein [Vicinamibacterales bacterium]|nr:PKD domain-containing protein [Vicinamibacterales bacterium]